MLYVEGIIIDINVNCKTNPRTDYEVYSKVKTKDGKVLSFNSKTKISGCKFKYLSVGDRVLVRSVEEVSHNKRHKLKFIKTLEVLDLEKKWETILKKDPKLNYIKVREHGQIIAPQVINLDREIVINNQDKLDEHIRTFKFKKKIYKIALQLYREGKPFRFITSVIGMKTARSSELIVKRHLKLWGLL